MKKLFNTAGRSVKRDKNKGGYEMKKVVLIVLAITMVVSLAACSQTAPAESSEAPASQESTQAPASEAESEAATESEDAYTIGFSQSTLTNAFFVGMRIGVMDEADKLGVDVVEVNANGDIATQTSQMEDLISQGVDAIIANPIDSDAIVPAEQKAVDAGIPVIYCDRGSSSGNYTAFIATDNVAMGAIAADKIAEFLTEKNGSPTGNVVEIQGLLGTSAAKDRGQGFNDRIAAEYPDITIVASQAGDFDQETSLNVMTNILQANPEIDAVYGHNDDCTLGAAKAIEAAGKMVPAGEDGHIYIIGIDGIMDALTAIEEGKIDVTIAQDPIGMGANAVDLAVAVLNGETVEKDVIQPFKVLDATNAMDPTNWAIAAAAQMES
jgi:ribose transport system substrate-binding protein